MQASLAVRKMMAELKLLNGPLGHLEIGPKIGEGGFGVVHVGEGGRWAPTHGGAGEVGGPTASDKRVHHPSLSPSHSLLLVVPLTLMCGWRFAP